MHNNNNNNMNARQPRNYNDLDCICIPGIDVSYTKTYIAQVLRNIGVIKYIAEIPLKNNDRLKRVILYIEPKRETQEYKVIHDRFESGLDVKLFHAGESGEKPWFWKIARFDKRSFKFVETYIKRF
jgi:hypothetical protein